LVVSRGVAFSESPCVRELPTPPPWLVESRMVESDRFLELASGADVRALVSLLMPLLGGVVVLLGDVVVELLGGVVVVVLDGDVLLMPLVDEVSLAVPVTSPVEVDVPLLLYELDRSLCTRMRVDDVVVVSVVVWAAATCAPAVAIKAAALMASGTMKRCCMQTSPGESSQSSPIRHHCAGVGPAVEHSRRNRRRGSAPRSSERMRAVRCITLPGS